MKFGKVLGATPKKAKGKPGQQAMLPSREALAQLTKGSPDQQALGNYAKLTPSGAGAPATYPAIIAEAENNGVDV